MAIITLFLHVEIVYMFTCKFMHLPPNTHTIIDLLMFTQDQDDMLYDAVLTLRGKA